MLLDSVDLQHGIDVAPHRPAWRGGAGAVRTAGCFDDVKLAGWREEAPPPGRHRRADP